MSCIKDQPATAAGLCPCVLSSVMTAHLKLADNKLKADGRLDTVFHMNIKEFVYPIYFRSPEFIGTDEFHELIRDCCVAFMPDTMTLLGEGRLLAASELKNYDVVMIHVGTPYFDVQVLSQIHRDENGAYAGLSSPVRCDDLREATGMSTFYPTQPPSARERTAARGRLRDILDAEFVAEACAGADEPATAA